MARPPGDSVWEQSRWIAKDQTLRRFVLNEPWGGVFKYVNLLVPPKNKPAAFGFIIVEPEHAPPMSGSNTICVAIVLLDISLIQIQESETSFVLEAPTGLVPVKAYCENSKAQSIEIENIPSFADKLGAKLEVPGIGTLTVDTAYDSDSFVLVDAPSLGFEIVPDEARDLAEIGAKITAAANEQIGFQHPTNRDWHKISFWKFVMPIELRMVFSVVAIPLSLNPANSTVRLVTLAVRPEWRCFVPEVKCRSGTASWRIQLLDRGLTALYWTKPMLATWRLLSQR